MPKAKVVLILQGDEEHWKTSLILSQHDAQQCLDLLRGGSAPDRLDMPSLDGFVELRPDGRVLLGYGGHEMIVVNRAIAEETVVAGLRTAQESDLDEAAHQEAWDWLCDRHAPNILNLELNQKLEGQLLYRRRDYIVVQAADGAVWFAEVSGIYGKIWMGEHVTLAATADGLVARPAGR